MSAPLPKLLICSHTYGLYQNRAKIRALAKHFQVAVVCAKFEQWEIFGRPGEKLDEEDPGDSFPVIKLSRFPKTINSTRFYLKGMASYMAEFSPDIILCENEPWSIMRWQAWWLKTLYSPHSMFVEFTWENIKRTGLRGFLLKQIYKASVMTGQKFICGNQAAADLLKDAGAAKSRLLVTGQMGIDAKDHPPATPEEKKQWKHENEIPAESLIIGFCGRFVEEKGIWDLINAVKALRVQHPHLCLCFMGSGPLYDQLAEAAFHERWIRLLPAVSHSEVPHVLKQFDALVLPSKKGYRKGRLIWEEQFGHVLLESMAAGILTLGSDSGGIPEVLRDKEIQFRAGDPKSLRLTLSPFLENQEKRKRKAIEQRNNCLIRWDNINLAKLYADFLSSPIL